MIVVVTGFSALAAALRETGQFERVEDLPSTSAMRAAITQLGSPDASRIAFLFGDATVEDTEPGLVTLIGKLGQLGYRSMILNTRGNAAALAQPTATPVVDAPFTVNTVLGAINGLGLGVQLAPVPTGDVQLQAGQQAMPHQTQPDAAPPQAPPAAQPLAAAPPAAPPAAQPHAAAPQQAQPAAAPPPGMPSDPYAQPGQPPAAAPMAPGQPAPQPPATGPGGSPSHLQPAPQAPADPYSQQPHAPAQQPVAGAPSWQEQNFSAEQQWGVTPAGAAVPQPGGYYQQPQSSSLGRVIVVTSPKGGVGKTSGSINLAATLGMVLQPHGKKVILIDTSYGQADVSRYLATWNPNITHIVRSGQQITPANIADFLVHKPELNLWCLLGPSTPDQGNPAWLTPELFTELIHVATQVFDFVICDTPVAEVAHPISDAMERLADFIICMVAPNLATLLGADQYLKTITAPQGAGGRGIDANRIGYILNQAQRDIGCDPETVYRNLASWRHLATIPDSKAYRRANNEYRVLAQGDAPEIRAAWAQALYIATGEEPLRSVAEAVPDVKPAGFFDKIKKAFGGDAA